MKGKFQIGSFVSMPTSDNDSNNKNKVLINIHDIKNNPMNFYRVKDIEAMAKRLTFAPDMDRISVFEDGDKYMLCSGHKRVAALLYGLEKGYEFSSEIIKGDMIEVTLKDFGKEERELGKGIFTKEDFQVLDLILPNKGQRRNLSVAEEAKEIEYLEPVLRKEYDYKKTLGELAGVKWRTYFADLMEMSETRLQRFIDYRKLSPEVKEAIEKDQIKFTAAVDIANLPHDEQNKIIFGLQKQGTEMTGKAVKEARAKVDEKTKPPKLPERDQTGRSTEIEHKKNQETENLETLENEGQTVLPNTYPVQASPEGEDFSNAQMEGEIEIRPLDIPEEYGKLSIILLKKDAGYVAGFRFEHAEELAEEAPEEDDVAKSSKEEVIQDEILFLKKYGTPKVRQALAAGGYIEKETLVNATDPVHEEAAAQQNNPFKEIKESLRNCIVRVELARDSDQLKEQLVALRVYLDETIEKITD